MIDLAWSFAPWIIFALAAKSTSYPAAVIGAIVVAAVVIGRAIARHHVHLLDVASSACFVVLGAITLPVPGSAADWTRAAVFTASPRPSPHPPHPR